MAATAQPAIVVGMERQHDGVTVLDGASEPFDLIGVDVRGGVFHGGRQVDDHLAVRRGFIHIHHRLADLDREVQLGAGEGFGRVFVDNLGVAEHRRVLAAQLGAPHGDVDDARFVQTEHHPTLQLGGGVVEVHDGPVRPLDRLVCAFDQLGAGLGEHLHRHVFGDQILFDDGAQKIEIGLAGGGETDLDLLEPHLDQQVEHAPFALHVHGVDEGLVAVSQIDRAPDRRRGDDLVGPGPAGKVHPRVGPVAVEGHLRGADRGGGHVRKLLVGWCQV